MQQPQQPCLHDLRETDGIPSALLARTEADLSSFSEQVKPIVEAVRTQGDRALQQLRVGGWPTDLVKPPDCRFREHTDSPGQDAYGELQTRPTGDPCAK